MLKLDFYDSNIPSLHLLKQSGEYFQRLDYLYEEKGGTHDAAIKLRLDEHTIVKSLVFDNGKELRERRIVMVLMHGDLRVSLHKLERISGIKRLMPSSPQIAIETTGYIPGGICPFCLKSSIPIFIQESLLELPILYVNAGRRGTVLAVHPSAFQLVSPIVCDIAGKNRITTIKSRKA